MPQVRHQQQRGLSATRKGSFAHWHSNASTIANPLTCEDYDISKCDDKKWQQHSDYRTGSTTSLSSEVHNVAQR